MSVTLFTQAEDFFCDLSFLIHVFCFYCSTLLCPIMNLFDVQSRIPPCWNFLVICNPLFYFFYFYFFSTAESPQLVDWRVTWNIETDCCCCWCWWWAWGWRWHSITDLTCRSQWLHLDNKLLLHQTNLYWFGCQQLLASALSQDTACFGLCACWS